MAVIKDIKGPRVPGGTTGPTKGAGEAAPADETQPDLPAVEATATVAEVPDEFSRLMAALPEGTPDLDDPGSPQALKAVHTLMPDLDTIRELSDVSPKRSGQRRV